MGNADVLHLAYAAWAVSCSHESVFLTSIAYVRPPPPPLDLQGKTNFFEKRVGEYQKSGVMAGLNSKLHDFNLDEDF